MPRIKMTKSTIDALPIGQSDVIYWDVGRPGFGVKVTPKGRKVFVVLYRIGGSGSRLRKYTIGPYGRVTLHQAQVAAQKVFTAKLEGRDPAGEKREAKRRIVADRVDDLLEAYIAQHVSQRRSSGEISRLLRREIGKTWGGRSIHEITKRDAVEVITAIEQRGAPIAANKTLKTLKTFLRWYFWLRGRSNGDATLLHLLRSPFGTDRRSLRRTKFGRYWSRYRHNGT
jgi:Arm DNA-binding domain